MKRKSDTEFYAPEIVRDLTNQILDSWLAELEKINKNED